MEEEIQARCDNLRFVHGVAYFKLYSQTRMKYMSLQQIPGIN
jgi:hypothetical protein